MKGEGRKREGKERKRFKKICRREKKKSGNDERKKEMNMKEKKKSKEQKIYTGHDFFFFFLLLCLNFFQPFMPFSASLLLYLSTHLPIIYLPTTIRGQRRRLDGGEKGDGRR